VGGTSRASDGPFQRRVKGWLQVKGQLKQVYLPQMRDP
jgi:hypothetical protein